MHSVVNKDDGKMMTFDLNRLIDPDSYSLEISL